MPSLSGRGHRPCHSARLILDQPGAIAPGPRPPRHRRALCTRRVGRWPSVGPGPAGLRGSVPHGRGKRGSRFLIPPGEAKALSPLLCQGPSPLPQRHNTPCPAGAQSPRPAPAPPPAGAGLCRSRTRRSAGHRRARAGKSAAFPGAARRANPFPRIGKILSAGRRLDCFFTILSGTIFAADVRRRRCRNPSKIVWQ